MLLRSTPTMYWYNRIKAGKGRGTVLALEGGPAKKMGLR
jgi:hypothetical protein